MSSTVRIILGLAALTAVAYFTEGAVQLLADGDFSRWKLVPWMVPIVAAILLPILWLYREGRLTVADPFVYQTITYLAPIFLVGSAVYIVTGVTDIPEAALIEYPARAYPAAMLYSAIAIAAFGIGVVFRPAGRAGVSAASRLPLWRWSSDQMIIPGLVLFAAGGAIKFVNFSMGTIGFQIADISRFSAAIFFLGMIFNIGQFLLWFAIFSAERLKWRHVALAAMMLVLLPLFAALAGSRGYLFSLWLIVVLAFATSGIRPTIKSIGFLLAFGALSLGLGIMFGSAFRAIKLEAAIEAQATAPAQPPPVAPKEKPAAPPAGSAPSAAAPSADTAAPAAPAAPALSGVEQLSAQSMRRVTIGEQLAIAREAAERVSNISQPSGLWGPARGIASRLNTLTQLAVLVARYGELRDQVPATLGSSVWIGIATALIPRAIWPDKPTIGDPKNYGTYFFEFSTNSFAMTPFGDLLINFGPLGIVPGMFLLGVMMRFIYSALIESSPGAAGRAAIYAVVLSQLSMEGAFGTIIPWLLRTAIVCVAAIVLAGMLGALAERLLGWPPRRRSA